MTLYQILKPEHITLSLKAKDKKGIIEELVDLLVKNYPDLDRKMVLEAVLEREKKGTTGVGEGLALPHGRAPIPYDLVMVMGYSREGINFDSIDNKPVHLLFLVVASLKYNTQEHLEILKEIVELVKNTDFMNRISEVKSSQEAWDLLVQKEQELAEKDVT